MFEMSPMAMKSEQKGRGEKRRGGNIVRKVIEKRDFERLKNKKKKKTEKRREKNEKKR